MKKIKDFDENILFKIDNIDFLNSHKEPKKVYPSVIVDFMKTDWQTRDKIRKEMDNFMYNQGFMFLPKFVDINGNIIKDETNVLNIRDKYPGFKWVFMVEEKNLEASKKIANKYNVDFYKL